MTRTWCDACEKEVTSNSTSKNVSIPCHLFSFKGKSGYVDHDGMPTSGRGDGVVLCSKCWNLGWGAFLKKLNLPRKEHLQK